MGKANRLKTEKAENTLASSTYKKKSNKGQEERQELVLAASKMKIATLQWFPQHPCIVAFFFSPTTRSRLSPHRGDAVGGLGAFLNQVGEVPHCQRKRRHFAP